MQRLRERLAQMPKDSPARGRLFDILLRLHFRFTARDIHNVHRPDDGRQGGR
jgi:hypothetical protein